MVLSTAGAPALAAGGPDVRMEPIVTDLRDLASLQRGAKLFVNYCLNCHSAKYMRYNRLTDLGLTGQQISDNLIFTGRFEHAADGSAQFIPAKLGDQMQVSLPTSGAKAWFGVPPPDLSVEARVRGTSWLYNYLIGFYQDEKSATGWNNMVFPNVGMPHAMWELSGVARPVTQEFPTRVAANAAAIAARAIATVEPTLDGKYLVKTLRTETPGRMNPVEYRAAVGDLVTFLEYVAEPAKHTRVRIGLVVLLFLGLLLGFAYWLKREYWKDVH
jgi:ubiquinol-cytochrome c reductase cytochrome c1 subunit